MHKYSTIFLTATLVNLFNSAVFTGDANTWYHLVHKTQLCLLIVSGPFYVHNKTNFGAMLGYLAITIMNWFIFIGGSSKPIWLYLSIVSGIAYALTLIIILFIEKWK